MCLTCEVHLKVKHIISEYRMFLKIKYNLSDKISIALNSLVRLKQQSISLSSQNS